jgi:hypothetical protein
MAADEFKRNWQIQVWLQNRSGGPELQLKTTSVNKDFP